MNYRKTLNLPQMYFPKNPDFAKIEDETISSWQSLDIYERHLKNNRGKSKHITHTPPQKAYGDIDILGSFNMILKDIMLKYRLMNGDDFQHIPIWNSYNMEVEREVLQNLAKIEGISSSENEAYKSKIRRKCYELSRKYSETQKGQLQRLGIFARWNRAVLTSDPAYELEMIRSFGALSKLGHLTRTSKSRFWCINCEIDVDDSEIEYSGYDLLSLYVKFPVMQEFEELGENVYMLIWTNMPWVLSSVRPIAVHPDYEYSAIGMESGSVLILANNLIDSLMDKFQNGSYKIIRQMKGSELKNVVCSHPLIDKNLKVLMDKHVSIEKGTGCVYNISGHIDYRGVDIDKFHSASFEEILGKDSEFYFDKKVFDPNNPISIELEKRGYLLSSDLSEQMYPHCLYCNQPLIIKSYDHWHFNLSANHLRQKTIRTFNALKWLPINSKKKIRHDIEKDTKWNISNRRIWGIPIPVFYCSKCDHQLDMDDSFELCSRLIEQKSVNSLISMKPEDILSYDTVCSNCGASDFRLDSDTLNPDFISVMSYKSILANQKNSSVDVDLSLGSNSHNGKWDSLSLSSSMAIEGELPFKSVIKYGCIKNDDGENESIMDLVDGFGVDMVRLCATSANPNRRIKVSESHIKSISKPYIRIRNAIRFILGNLGEFDPKGDSVDYDNLHEIDKWILYKLTKLVEKANRSYESHQFHHVYSMIYRFFVFDFNKVYVSIVRRRLYTFPKWSLGRRAIQTVLYQIVTTVAKLIAPILPFTAEEIWGYIPGAKEEYVSIYLSSFPNSSKSQDKDSENTDNFESDWNKILKIRSSIYRTFEKNRSKLEIKNLSQASITLYIDSKSESFKETYDLLYKIATADILAEIFMVSKVQVMPPDSPIPDVKYDLKDVDGVSIEIRPTTGSKCERCLIYSNTVGTSELYPTLCDRCIAVLEGEASYA